ncbi:unnamed protein product [Ectocarpus sp. 12 AP-2014]
MPNESSTSIDLELVFILATVAVKLWSKSRSTGYCFLAFSVLKKIVGLSGVPSSTTKDFSLWLMRVCVLQRDPMAATKSQCVLVQYFCPGGMACTTKQLILSCE